jgi:putative copper resistance protein D
MDLGKAAAARAVVAALAFALSLALPAGRTGNAIAAGLGTPAVASLAWMGHAAGSGNRLHLASDIVHALAASLWIGALAGFVLLLVSERAPADTRRLHAALERFSAVGVAMVLALVLSGLANAWYVIGLDHIGQSLSRPYGKLLLAKLAAFAGMVVLAAINRYRLTPALEAQPGAATLACLRRSIGLEATLGFTTLALVAWRGTLEPFG